MLRVLAFLAVAVVVLSPAASACSYAFPDAFNRLEWPEDRGLLASFESDVGAVHATNGSLEEIADAFPGLLWAVSPDGHGS
jgi:hypothetical protein